MLGAMKRVAAILMLALITARAADDQAITIPVKRSHGRIILSARVGESKPLTFLLDSACTIPTLHPALVDELNLTASGRVRINGIAGEERAPTYRGVVLDLRGAKYAPRRVASIPSERSERRRRDGVVDAGFFRSFVVEVPPGEDIIRLYSPTNFSYAGSGEIVPFRFKEEIPVISASVILPDKQEIQGEFEIDTGCDSGLCIGESFIKRHNLLEKIEGRSSEKFGVGGSVETRSAHIPVLRIGKQEMKEVQADFFVAGSPVDDPLAGHIGMGLLGKRRVIFDYSRKRLIIEEPESSD